MINLESKNMVCKYERTGNEPKAPSRLEIALLTIGEFGIGFGHGIYYQMKQNFNSMPGVDYDQMGIDSLPKDKNTGGIGFSTPVIGYGVGKLVAHPLSIALEVISAYSIYQNFK